MTFQIVSKSVIALCMLMTLLIENIENQLEKDLEKIASYFDDSQMIMNPSKGKTELLIFGTGKRLASTKKQIDIKYRGYSIESVSGV